MKQNLFNKSNMKYRKLGKSGLDVSVISFGFWTNQCSSHQQNKQLVTLCLKNGINYFDTAQAYNNGKNQQDLGKIFKQIDEDRSNYVISTKIWKAKDHCMNSYENTNKKHVKESMKASLKRLQMDYVDIVYAHDFDYQTPLQQVCRSFHQVIEEGQAFYWATSNWDADRVFEALSICEKYNLHKPIAAQNQYNMINRKQIQSQYRKLFQNYGYGLVAYSPLLGGYLTGKYLDDQTQQGRFKSESTSGWSKQILTQIYYHGLDLQNINKSLKVLKQIATNQIQCELIHLALAWVINFKFTSTALVGARNPQQLQGILKTMNILPKLSLETEGKINKILQTQPNQRMDWKVFTPSPHLRPYSTN